MGMTFTRFGWAFYALGSILLGAFCFAYGDFLLEWTALPAAFPGRLAAAYANGALLIGAGAALAAPTARRIGAFCLAAIWFANAALHVPGLIADWRTGLGVTAECLGLGFAALMISGGEWTSSIGRYGFGLCLPAYGAVHFLYPTFVADWVPKWIPGPGLFWAYFTGAAHITAGLSVVSGVLARLASLLLAAMFMSWLLIVHIPRVAAAPHDRHEWTVLFVALLMNGAALTLAGVLRNARR